jgi:hypothetical protein
LAAQSAPKTAGVKKRIKTAEFKKKQVKKLDYLKLGHFVFKKSSGAAELFFCCVHFLSKASFQFLSHTFMG